MMASPLLQHSDLQTEIAEYLGYNAACLSAGQTAEINRIIQSGLRQFYYGANHAWSFLQPTASLQVSGSRTDLPAGFGGFLSSLTFDSGSGSYELQDVGEITVRRSWQISNTTGRPVLAAARVKSNDETTGSRWELIVAPPPDDVYTVQFTYQADPNQLDNTTYLYPLGGAKHSETILASCLAIAELRQTHDTGPQAAQYAVLLRGSIFQDEQGSISGLIGYMGDHSEIYQGTYNRMDVLDNMRGGVSVTFTGASGTNDVSTPTNAQLEKQIVALKGGGDGVQPGDGDELAVVATSTPSLYVTVSTGSAYINDQIYQLTVATNYGPLTAPTTNPRIDILQIHPDTGPEFKTGTEAAAPVAPTVDTGYLKLAEIYCRTSMANIQDTDDSTNAYITDTRQFR